MKKYKIYVGWGIGLLLVSLLFIRIGPSVFQQILHATPLYLVLAFLVTVVIFLSTTYRWQLILNTLIGQETPSFFQLLYYVVMGATVGLLVPRDIGEMSTRIASMKFYHQITLSKITFSVLIDRFFDVLILVPFMLSAFPFLSGYPINLPILVGLNTVIFLLCLALLSYKQNYRSIGKFIEIYHNSIYPRWGRTAFLPYLRLPQPQSFEFLPEILSPKLVLGVFCWTTVKFLALVLRSFLISRALNLEIPFDTLFLSTPVAQASLILAFTPGGLGFNELGWYGALVLLGIETERIAPFLLGHRLFNYVFVLILASACQVLYIFKARGYFSKSPG